MKRPYVKPRLENYEYVAEEGFAHSLALQRDYVLIEGNDRATQRASDEITEYTDVEGEYTLGLWQ